MDEEQRTVWGTGALGRQQGTNSSAPPPPWISRPIGLDMQQWLSLVFIVFVSSFAIDQAFFFFSSPSYMGFCLVIPIPYLLSFAVLLE